jgi:hypothetical protein
MIDLAWDQWFLGIMEGFIHGATGAFTGGLATMIVDSANSTGRDPSHFSMSHPQRILEVMGSMFLLNGLFGMFQYLNQHSAPAIVTKTTTQTVEQTAADPPAVKVTTVETTATEEKPKS